MGSRGPSSNVSGGYSKQALKGLLRTESPCLQTTDSWGSGMRSRNWVGPRTEKHPNGSALVDDKQAYVTARGEIIHMGHRKCLNGIDSGTSMIPPSPSEFDTTCPASNNSHVIRHGRLLITLRSWQDGAAAFVRILMRFQSKDLEHFRPYATPSCKMIPIPRDEAMPE